MQGWGVRGGQRGRGVGVLPDTEGTGQRAALVGLERAGQTTFLNLFSDLLECPAFPFSLILSLSLSLLKYI